MFTHSSWPGVEDSEDISNEKVRFISVHSCVRESYKDSVAHSFLFFLGVDVFGLPAFRVLMLGLSFLELCSTINSRVTSSTANTIVGASRSNGLPTLSCRMR